MIEQHADPEISDIPEAVAQPQKGHRIQLVWLIPIIAALIGGGLAVKSYLKKGPTITITFKSGEGLEEGKTKIKYKDVEIGTVTDVMIARDLKNVVVTAEVKRGVKPYLVEDTKFWVVKPRITGGTVTGLGTLMGGSYIGMDVGTSTKAQQAFLGLEVPPVVAMDVPGSRYLLHGTNLGSLDTGSPILFRRIQVGQVISYALDRDGSGVTFTIFVQAPYDRYVTTGSRFWHASGIDLTLDANGLKVNTQSLVSLLVGGIAFQNLEEGAASPPAANAVFTLYPTRDEALKHQETLSFDYRLVFKESIRGLAVGAPVEFRGMVIGEVSQISAEFDFSSHEVNMVVDARIYPQRLRSRAIGPVPPGSDVNRLMNDRMVANGLRAQLKSGNMLTGQLYISVDFFPNAPKAKIDWKANPPLFPTTPSSLVELQTMLAQLAGKIDKLQLDELLGELRQAAKTLDATLKSADSMVQHVDREVVPEARAALEEARRTLAAAKQTVAADAPLQQDLREALRELTRSAQSLRVLTDYLDRHPESLIRGKQEDQP